MRGGFDSLHPHQSCARRFGAGSVHGINSPTDNLLLDLGVRGDLLTAAERATLDTQGFVSLGRLLADEQLDLVRHRVRELVDEEGEQGGSELFRSRHIRHPKEVGVDRLADLVNKGPVFDPLYTHPRLLAAITQVLGAEIQLSSLNYRAARPGEGHQKLHVDWKEAVQPGDFTVCNSIWLLDDFSAANGATRLVPGSHRWGRMPEEVMDDPRLPHPEEVILEAPAGTVVVFNSHLWHGGTTNRTALPRRAIHSYFSRRDQPQQTPQQELFRPATRERLSAGARWLLNVG